MRLPRALDVLRALRDPTADTAAAAGSGGEGDGGGGAGGWFNVSRMCRIVVRPDSVVYLYDERARPSPWWSDPHSHCTLTRTRGDGGMQSEPPPPEVFFEAAEHAEDVRCETAAPPPSHTPPPQDMQ